MKYIFLILILNTFNFAINIDVDADNKYDEVSTSYEQEKDELLLKLSFDLSSNKSIKKIKIYSNHEDINANTFSLGLKEGFSGEVVVAEQCCGIDKRYYLDYYIYNKKLNDWILYKTLYANNIFKEDQFGFRYLTDKNITVSQDLEYRSLISNRKYGKEFIKKYTKKDINLELTRLINEFKLKSRVNIDFFKIYNLLTLYPISLKNIRKYNDIAYYLEKANSYKESIYLLEKILEKHPKRTVAYLNLADSYWKDDNKNKAIKNYKIYIHQMKENKKEKKIPKEIFNKLNISFIL